MASTIVVPNLNATGFIPELQAAALIAVATAAAADINLIQTPNTARAVATTLGAYAAASGVITMSSNGALAAQDGVTMVAGDVLFVQEGIANVTAADAGPYTITSLGGASAKVVLTRPPWWANGGLIAQSGDVKIGPEGTLFGGCTQKSFVTTAIKVIGTDAPVFWPNQVSKKVTLASGTLAAPITTIPVRSSAGLTAIIITSLPSTAPHANTRVLRVSALTAGVSATASIQIVAESAPGTTNASDVGDYALTIRNW